jgi:hypothetical protein
MRRERRTLLQVAAGELAAATHLRQARPLSTCIRFSPMGAKLWYTAVAILARTVSTVCVLCVCTPLCAVQDLSLQFNLQHIGIVTPMIDKHFEVNVSEVTAALQSAQLR